MAFDMTTALTIKANVVGQEKVDKFGKSLGKVEQNSDRATTGLQKLAKAGNSLTGVLARVGVAAAAANFVRAGIEADRTSKRLVNLTKEYGETARVQEFASDMARRYGISQGQAANAVSDLFGRLRPMNISLEEIQTVFQGVNTAAARMNLTTEQTDNVMLQLSQALGSGKLQGDEFRSIMEQLPAVGQAVAASMDVTVAELKELSSKGKITTDVVIKALEDLANQPAPAVDSYKQFQASLADLSATIGTKLLPALTPFVQAANALLGVFTALPGPLQSLVAGVVALGAGLVIVAPAIPGIIAGFKALAALKIGAMIAGYLPVLAGLGGALSGLIPIIAGVFTGPVGWAALLAAGGVALFNFRDQIGEFLANIVGPFQTVFAAIGDAMKAPFMAIVGFIKGILNNVLGFVGRAINSAINRINSLIQGVNNISSKIGIPGIPLIPNVEIPQFAKGGMVNGAQLAVVGEAGPEYIVPAGKAQGFAKNILAGVRGPGAIPAYAEGGYVGPVNITTGPVMQQGGTNYVTMAQFEAGIRDVASAVTRNGRSYGSRRFTGIS